MQGIYEGGPSYSASVPICGLLQTVAAGLLGRCAPHAGSWNLLELPPWAAETCTPPSEGCTGASCVWRSCGLLGF